MPTNFKTYEAQSRLLVAVLASAPELRLNFKAIAQHFGSDVTVSAIEHRFRPLKKHAQAVREAVVKGKDARSMAEVIGAGGKEIAKYYGESTPAGLEFQFRSVKKDAKAVREAVAKGESPLSTARKTGGAGSSSTTTPSTTPQSGTKRKSAAPTPMSSSSAAKRARVTPMKPVELVDITDGNEEIEGSVVVDYEQLELTPTRAPKNKPSQQSQSRSPPLRPQFYQTATESHNNEQQQQQGSQHYQSTEQPMHTSMFGNGPSHSMTTPGLSLEATPSEEDFSFPSPSKLAVQAPGQQYNLPSMTRPGADSSFYLGSDAWDKDDSHDQDLYPGDDDESGDPLAYSFDYGAA